MVNKISPLQAGQLTFLEENFVVFDPESGKTNTDFSRLHECKLILIGEIHGTVVLHRLHALFLKTIFQNTPACILKEGLQPGQILCPRDIPEWEDLPQHLTLCGSDVRTKSTAEVYLKWLRLNFQKAQLHWKSKNAAKETFSRMASIVNEAFNKGNATIDEKQKRLLVEESTARQISQLIEQAQKEDESKFEQIRAIIRQKNDLVTPNLSITGTSADLVRSNEAFKNVALASCEKFPTVVAIWGKMHFICNNELFYDLEKANIRSIVLLPNAKKADEADEEILWQKEESATVNFTIQSKSMEATFRFPKIFHSFFHSSIQMIFEECVEKNGDPQVLNTEKFLDLAKRGMLLKFPSQTWFHFEGFPSAVHNAIDDLVDDKSKLTTKVKKNNLLALLVSGLSHMLLVGSLRVSSFDVSGVSRCCPKSVNEKPVVAFSSDKPFTIKLTDSNPMGSMRYLLREMKRFKRTEWILRPGQCATFFDISLEERALILANQSQQLSAWLQSKMPKNTTFQLSGECEFAPSRVFFEDGNKEGVTLKTNNGFKIVLHSS